MIVAGFGFRAGAGEDSLADALRLATGAHAPDALATAADKAASLASLAARLRLSVIPVSADQLRAQRTHTQSQAAETARGTGSVAEAAALAAAGPGARLVAPRYVSQDRMATCALAIGAFS
ncbi:cobalamin biosynthesis protein [Thalassococcus sp. S3]|uniref:cobalamin biosynthesis protein n=1 Tax=Thalassococcus sp. S3 TaxID=2017482 RepID=UPI0010242A0B|nr:cobalamin biosynthesis protein [Thalassococcus sp. S3]QBF30351.1 precorrin methylase [Thalassococcus sp. S3]